MTVAIFSIPDRRQVPYGNGWISSFSNNELTPRLTADWPAEARQRFWAFRSLEDATGLSRKRAERDEGAYLAGVEHDRSTIDPYIDRESRGSTRRGPVQRLLWVQVRAQGLSLVIDARETGTGKAQR
jgi:hypothetical protein